MYSTQLSSKRLILLFFFGLCFVNRASSRTCYVCESYTNESCFTKISQSSFAVDCAENMKNILKSIHGSSEHLRALVDRYSTDDTSESIYTFECVTINGRNLDDEKIVRSCVPKGEDCTMLQTPLLASGFLTDSCYRCDADLCNKSNRVSVGVWCVLSSLVSVFFITYL